MLRVTKDRKPKYVSLGISILPKYWDFEKNRPTSKCPNKELIEKIILKNTGVNIALISQALGHQDIKTTEIYLSKFDDKQMDEIMSNLL